MEFFGKEILCKIFKILRKFYDWIPFRYYLGSFSVELQFIFKKIFGKNISQLSHLK